MFCLYLEFSFYLYFSFDTNLLFIYNIYICLAFIWNLIVGSLVVISKLVLFVVIFEICFYVAWFDLEFSFYL